ncbi:dehydrogenase [Marinicrinis lubricantis]|uniref:Dehydrogenase n=1 Tax=Marinicrinis lubricantis TaxID=2086470 RepID=A0ABW1IJH2_9BACL
MQHGPHGQKEKHQQALPSARKIRRTCNKELYRTVKKLGIWIPADKLEQGEQLYFRKVASNLIWVFENGNNRKKLADWFEEAVAPELADLWEIDKSKLSAAFRSSFGG